MKRAIVRAAVLLAVIAIVLAVWAFYWEPRRLVVREERVALSCWSGPPLRIAVVSDLHVGSPHTGVAKLERVVERINEGKPDLIVLLGDFVIQDVLGGRFVPPERIAEILQRLRAPLGVYAVLGNHDWWLNAARVRTALQSRGIPVIDDDAVRLRNFWLAGVSDYLEGAHDVRRALSKATRENESILVITHNPDVFPEIPQRVCLTIAGHTHGGQVALPIVGRLIVPSKYGQRYAIGHIHEHGKQLFVTAGVGTSIIPVRFRVPPEIVFLTVCNSQSAGTARPPARRSPWPARPATS